MSSLHPDTPVIIAQRLAEQDIVLAPKTLAQWRNTAPHLIDKIVEGIVRKTETRRQQRAVSRVRVNRNHPFKKAFKLRLLEAQNHRCVYCTCRLDTRDYFGADYPTYEHVHALKDGGRHAFRNMVVACQFCNGMRDRLGLTAYEYAEWATGNLHAIEAAKLSRERRQNNRMRPRPGRGKNYCPPPPFYDYE